MVRLTRKELRETLRDRRTVITLVLMPLLVYPLLSISFNKSLLLTAEQSSKTVVAIGVESEREMTTLQQLLLQGSRLRATQTESAAGAETAGWEGVTGLESREEGAELQWFAGPMLENEVADMEVQLAVRVHYSAEALCAAFLSGRV